ncbi:Magnesium-chelatase subunit ChlI homolog [uncultured Alphaproteobacteria bacterium]|uniref:Magnesium-chelatase 38 kDa subunit n=1 Tax=uncultured Alphaproteobacteria bacterium TaxID=91750 RepID=A0A212IUP4_9PROT|nr:Magnesium-chelatase subunit ChlI homolog [uncultured Alphaproteobacteria bacterium]
MVSIDTASPAVYPFVAIVGQETLKRSLILNVVNPGLSGVLIRGEKGTAKSTAVRALADLLPEISVVEGDPFQSDPDDPRAMAPEVRARFEAGEALPVRRRKVRVVELPISATEDRVVGTLDLETALKEGRKTIEPGLLAAANRGLLYVDEVNLLDDHVVDVLLDSAAMGVNTIEREGISFSHPARFTLIGTMNPEEGDLRPQLLDRFGLCVQVEGLDTPADRVEVVKRRAAYEENPEAFAARWAEETARLRDRIAAAIALCPQVTASDAILLSIAERSLKLGVDGHRSDIVMLKAAKALAAWAGREAATPADVEAAAALALPHRMRRRPFEDILGPHAA